MMLCGFTTSGYAVASSSEGVGAEPAPPLNPLSEKHANWVFSGAVTTETGESYEYFLQVKRQDDQLKSIAYLIDAQSKAMIFMEDGTAQLTPDSPVDNWTIGATFLRYNAINSSWIFGLDKGNQVGFNFKVDMLKQGNHEPVFQQFRQGVQVAIVQTGQVNGLIQFKEEGTTQFVTGKKAWFRQVVLTESHSNMPDMQGLLCRFDDGSQLYAMKLMKADVVKDSLSGLYNAEGAAVAVSQFIHVEHPTPGPWKIRVTYPKLQFELTDPLQHQSLVMGFMTDKNKPGFCVISQDGLG
jgi:hypothetical protein